MADPKTQNPTRRPLNIVPRTIDVLKELITEGAIRNNLETPLFAGVVSAGQTIRTSFPGYWILPHAQATGNNYTSRYHRRFRMEIYFAQKDFNKENEDLTAQAYLEDMVQMTMEAIRDGRQRLSATKAEFQLSIPTYITQGNLNFHQVRMEAGLYIIN